MWRGGGGVSWGWPHCWLKISWYVLGSWAITEPKKTCFLGAGQRYSTTSLWHLPILWVCDNWLVGSPFHVGDWHRIDDLQYQPIVHVIWRYIHIFTRILYIYVILSYLFSGYIFFCIWISHLTMWFWVSTVTNKVNGATSNLRTKEVAGELAEASAQQRWPRVKKNKPECLHHITGSTMIESNFWVCSTEFLASKDWHLVGGWICRTSAIVRWHVSELGMHPSNQKWFRDMHFIQLTWPTCHTHNIYIYITWILRIGVARWYFASRKICLRNPWWDE